MMRALKICTAVKTAESRLSIHAAAPRLSARLLVKENTVECRIICCTAISSEGIRMRLSMNTAPSRERLRGVRRMAGTVTNGITTKPTRPTAKLINSVMR